MKKAFSLIELVVVIALIAILSVSLGSKVLASINQAKVSKVLNNLSNLRIQLSNFQVENGRSVDFNNDIGGTFDNVFQKEGQPKIPTYASSGLGENSEIYRERTNEGGWVYFEDTEELYANLPNSVYTGKDNEIWNGEKIDMSSPTTPNPTYDSIEEFIQGKVYKNGDLVSKDGIVYICTNDDYYTTAPNHSYSFWAWGIVGTIDGSPVELNSENKNEKKFAIGTVVKYTDTSGSNNPPSGEYMYAPTYGIETQWNNSYFSKSSEWIKITDDNRDSLAYTNKDTVYYDWNGNYKQGDVVWHKGSLYEANGSMSGVNNTPAKTPENWTKL